MATTDTTASFFALHSTVYSAQTPKQQTAIMPFKDHPQFPLLINILSCKDNHHVILRTTLPHSRYGYLLDSFAQYLAQDNIPSPLNHIDIVHFHAEDGDLSQTQKKSMERHLLALCHQSEAANKYLLIVLTSMHALFPRFHAKDNSMLRSPFLSLIHHKGCRLIMLTHPVEHASLPLSPIIQHHFRLLSLSELSEADVMILLKRYRAELETFHQVVIPEDVLMHAYALAERYLSMTHTLEKAMLLLDSSAAYANMTERHDNSRSFKPVVSTTLLTSVLSTWTRLPVSQLHINKFKLHEFSQGMQQQLFGQEAAVTMIAQELQQAYARLHDTFGPFRQFLFVGPAHSGKKTAATALAYQLFKQSQILFFVPPDTSQSIHSITELKAKAVGSCHYTPLKYVIQHTPFAVIVFDHIELSSPNVLAGLQDILTIGQFTDSHGESFDFRQAIIILATTHGAQHLFQTPSSPTVPPDCASSSLDLMQLVLHDHQDHASASAPQELADTIGSKMTDYFPLSLCQRLAVIPFLPLDRYAIEKIMRVKLSLLGKKVHKQYGVELSYAPEVLRYLIHASSQIHGNDYHPIINIKKGLKSLYACTEQTLLEQVDKKNSQSNQLFLQLNETGQLLRCTWLALTTRQHTT
jgi:ATP-dependent Clp protease ATP-binding subunit ClpA